MLLLCSLFLGIDKPTTFMECPQGHYWSSIDYGCRECLNGSVATNFSCIYKSLTRKADATAITYENCIAEDSIPIGNKCYTKNDITTYTRPGSQWDGFEKMYVNEKDKFRGKVLYVCAMEDEYNDSCTQYIANLCANGHYNVPWCTLYNEKFEMVKQQVGNNYGYKYWPTEHVIFLKYFQNVGLDSVVRESMFKTDFKLGGKVNIYVARFSQWGEFLGFKVIEDELQFCRESIETTDEWRKFGYNYLSTCLNNLKEFLYLRTTEFYDLFIQDGVDQLGYPILRPIPIIDRAKQGNIDQNDSKDIEPGRRFFTFSNWSMNNGADTSVQYVSSAMFNFEILQENKNKINVPYLDISYSSITPQEVEKSDNKYIKTHQADDVNPVYSFRVKYYMNESKFWRNVMLISVSVLALSLVIIIITGFIYGRKNGADGWTGRIIMHIFSAVLQIIGSFLFCLVWFIAFYLWCFFKLQKSTHTTLSEEESYKKAIDVVWVAFAFLCIASIIIIWEHAQFSLYFIDWEQPRGDNVPVSTWRRIMIANEWNRLLTIRSYNLPFTLLTMVFLLNGFKWTYLSSPIPSTDYIDVGMHYKILIVALSSSLFISIIFIQYIWNYWIKWSFFGTPFLNFIDLCDNANISVLIMESTNHGHYIHGRSLHSHSDETMAKLNENLECEANGLVGTRGLLSNTEDQVFEVFLSSKFRQDFRSVMSQLETNIQGFSVKANAIPAQSVKAAHDLSNLLKKFFDGSSDNKYQVQPMSFTHKVFGFNPEPQDSTILTIEDETRYTDVLLIGIEWRLAFFYLVMFVGVEMECNSPGIAAFAVYLTDLLFVTVYSHIARHNLAVKTLLDDRFLL